jgi:hypothetical protein
LSNRISTKDNLACGSINSSTLMCSGACGKEENVTLFFIVFFFGQFWDEVLN